MKTTQLSDEQLQHILNNSYKNFHAKGLDYICLNRTPDLTEKVYLFSDITNDGIVAPHNHRYNFYTEVLSGAMVDKTYWESVLGEPYYRREWLTPLNGGNGFSDVTEVRLLYSAAAHLRVDDTHHTDWQTVHTLQILKPETAIYIRQYKDRIPEDAPTFTYFQNKEKPSLSGLYEKFTMDELLKKITLVNKLCGG